MLCSEVVAGILVFVDEAPAGGRVWMRADDYPYLRAWARNEIDIVADIEILRTGHMATRP